MRLHRTPEPDLDLEPFDVEYEITIGEAPRPNPTLLTIGRAVLGGYFLYNGIKHFREMDSYSGYAESQGVPMARAAVGVTGALLLVGGASLLSGVKPKLGALMLQTFLLGVSPTMHRFWKAEGQERQSEQINFTKNLALAGASLIAAAIPEPWPVSLSRKRELVDAL